MCLYIVFYMWILKSHQGIIASFMHGDQFGVTLDWGWISLYNLSTLTYTNERRRTSIATSIE